MCNFDFYWNSYGLKPREVSLWLKGWRFSPQSGRFKSGLGQMAKQCLPLPQETPLWCPWPRRLTPTIPQRKTVFFIKRWQTNQVLHSWLCYDTERKPALTQTLTSYLCYTPPPQLHVVAVLRDSLWESFAGETVAKITPHTHFSRHWAGTDTAIYFLICCWNKVKNILG